MNYKKDYIRIENLSQYLITPELYHPDDPRYISYWSEMKKKCIEGFWGEESSGYRYCPGRIFFYGNFCKILSTDEAEKTRNYIKPYIRDIEWERAYMLLEAEGFSGWSEDDKYTSDIKIFDVESLPDNSTRKKHLYQSNGRLKEYIPPRENIRKTHDKPLGTPLYYNSSKNILELGSRSGGKSFWYSLGVLKHALIFNSIKYYNNKNIKKPPKAELCIGSGRGDKSSEFIKKLHDSLNNLAVDNSLGVWGNSTDDDYEPHVFYKEMIGSIKPNNKENLYRHEYKVLEGGREITKGTGSYVAHVVYSPNKPDGASAASGGRYNYLVYEEIGLTSLLREAWLENEGTLTVEGYKTGIQIGLGTSGNMETILPSKEIFTHPDVYDLVSFNDEWEETGNIGFFLPAYLTVQEYKDKDGNTDVDKAFNHFIKRREKAAQADNPLVLASEKMKYPLVPSDMWQSSKGHRLPVREAELREKELMKNKTYEKIGTNIKLFWDSSKQYGVDYKVDNKAKAFYEHKFKYEKTNLNGAIRIYEFPEIDPKTNQIPNDLYSFIGIDPYVSDNIDEGESLGASYILISPKYIPQGYNGNTIAASYIGKPEGGRKQYYENLEKLVAFYGNPARSLWIEANRIDDMKNYFINQKKEHLLALRPQRILSNNVYARKITQYGIPVHSSGKLAKADLIDKLADWLLEETTLSDGTKRNIERIPDIFLIRQIQAFSLEHGNYDAVMAFLQCVLGLREREYQIKEEVIQENEYNPINFLANNKALFRQ